MTWKTTKNGNNYKLVDSGLKMTLHQAAKNKEFYLTCKELGFYMQRLKATDFDEAVRKTQILVLEKSTNLLSDAGLFTSTRYNENTFVTEG